MIERGSILIALLAAAATGCVAGAALSSPQPRPAAQGALVDQAQAQNEAIWSAILRGYAADTIATEADVTLRANAASGIGEQGAHTGVVLLSRPSAKAPSIFLEPEFKGAARPYRQTWLDSLIATHTIQGVCGAPEAMDCPDSVTTSFVALGDPEVTDDIAAVVEVYDQALNPTACRHQHGGFGGDLRVQFRLAKRDGKWVLLEGHMEASRATVC